jgi:hypothetical protein
MARESHRYRVILVEAFVNRRAAVQGELTFGHVRHIAVARRLATPGNHLMS